jgi:chromosome segregation ATPase
MPPEDDKKDPRERVDEALDKAKEGLGRLGGWLSRQTHAAAERARENPKVREQIEAVEHKLADRAEGKREQELAAAYDPAVERISELLERFEARLGELESARGVVNDNISALRTRAVAESDSEMADYRHQLDTLNGRINGVHDLLKPLREERDRLERRFHAAIARLATGLDSLEQLCEEARTQVEEANARLDAVLEGAGGS